MTHILDMDWYRAGKSGLISLTVIGAMVLGFMMSRTAVVSLPIVAGLAAALLCGIVQERDYTNGTVRNKVIKGHSRAAVYWAMYLATTLLTLLFAGVFTVCALLGFVLMKDPVPPAVWPPILYGLCTVPAFCAMYSLICAAWPRKGRTAACLVTVIVLFAVSAWLYGKYVQTQTPVSVFLSGFLPTGQAIRIVLQGMSPWLPLYDLGFCAVCWAVGIDVFRRKDIG